MHVRVFICTHKHMLTWTHTRTHTNMFICTLHTLMNTHVFLDAFETLFFFLIYCIREDWFPSFLLEPGRVLCGLSTCRSSLLPASAGRVLGLQARSTMSGSKLLYEFAFVDPSSALIMLFLQALFAHGHGRGADQIRPSSLCTTWSLWGVTWS